MTGPRPGQGDEPITPPLPQQAIPADEVSKIIEPLPPVGIPDDPPPHEGALFNLPLVIEPPDVITVEVLIALPGRPITGERLVRPDGTISLGFYGDVQVRGLTPAQAKLKIVYHLRRFLGDDVLGLRRIYVEGSKLEPLPKPGTRIPGTFSIEPDKRPFEKPDVERPAAPLVPDINKPVEEAPAKPATEVTPKAARASRRSRADRRRPRTRITAAAQAAKLDGEPKQKPDEAAKPETGEVVAGELVYIEPAETERVFVDIVSYNSSVYFVQGDVGTPGRLPFTGKETVLDALTYAGGLVPTAEPTDIHLYRPARGEKPAKDHSIDHAAILKGEAKANLQIFPNDRLVVGRNPIVKKTIDMDRAAAPINSILNSALQYSFTARSIGAASGDFNGTNQTQRDEALKRWVEFLWNFTSKDGNSLLDEKALRDAMLRKLDPPGESKATTTAPK